MRRIAKPPHGSSVVSQPALKKPAAKRFPGFEVGEELKQTHDPDGLEQLCLDVAQLPDEAALRARLDALSANGKLIA